MGCFFHQPPRSHLHLDARRSEASPTGGLPLRKNARRHYARPGARCLMSWFKQFFSRRRLYNDLSEEIRAHLDEKIDELVASGMPRKEATRAARREFGNLTLVEEDSRSI